MTTTASNDPMDHYLEGMHDTWARELLAKPSHGDAPVAHPPTETPEIPHD
jgi:hypothetical protein